jgi:hypothetical protein
MDKALVTRATSSDAGPTPGYMYGEICRMTHNSYEGCSQVAQFLLERIKKNNPTIKYKCLGVMKHVCIKGRPDFKKIVQRNMEHVKACLTFTGPPDPLRGEEPYKKVRQAAKEAIEAVYADGNQYAANAAATYGGRIQGFGNEPPVDSPAGVDERTSGGGFSSSGVSGWSGGGSSGMQGLGNYDPSQDKTWLEKASENVITKTIAAKAAVDTTMRKFRGDPESYSGGRAQQESSTLPPGGYLSNRGPMAYGASQSGYQGGSGPSAWEPPKPTGYESQATQPVIGGASEDYEEKAVAEICAPGGTRAVPQKELVDAFLAKSGNLDVDRVCEALLRHVGSEDWRVQSKALAVMEELAIFSPDHQQCMDEHGAADAALEACERSTKVAVKDRAKRVIVALGHELADSASIQGNFRRPSQPQPAQTGDLLGGDWAQDTEGGLFEDLIVSDEGPRRPVDSATKGDIFCDLVVSGEATPLHAEVSVNGSGLFEDLTISGEKSQPDLDTDLLGGLSASDVSPKTMPGLFGDLMVKAAPQAPQSGNSQQHQNGGSCGEAGASAFMFMGSSSSTSAPTGLSQNEVAVQEMDSLSPDPWGGMDPLSGPTTTLQPSKAASKPGNTSHPHQGLSMQHHVSHAGFAGGFGGMPASLGMAQAQLQLQLHPQQQQMMMMMQQQQQQYQLQLMRQQQQMQAMGGGMPSTTMGGGGGIRPLSASMKPKGSSFPSLTQLQADPPSPPKDEFSFVEDAMRSVN